MHQSWLLYTCSVCLIIAFSSGCPKLHCCSPFDGSALIQFSLLFLKGTLSMMCFVPLQPLLSTLFSLSLSAKQEAGCQDCNLKDLRTITLSTRPHVTQRQSIEGRKERHKTSGRRLKYCSVAFSILLHIHLCWEMTNAPIFRLMFKFS